MQTPVTTTTSTRTWDGVDRRAETPKVPLFGELLVESAWRPSDVVAAANEGWLRAFGYAKDRRAGK
ncbi:MAG: hypothetical protein INH41_23535 [Myxococcaceae bacterium]|jgi:hypothetical protein|nr:hypothetical protein [Myxococcaceae bacterium]